MPTQQFNASLEALRIRYAASFAQKRQTLAEAWDAFHASGDPETQRALGVHLHRLCGSAGAYGYERLGDLARAADNMLRDSPAASFIASGGRGAALATAVGAVLDELAAGAAEAARSRRTERLRVVLVEDDPAQGRMSAAELEARGCEVRVACDADALWQTLLTWPCHAVVLDYWLHGETAAEIAPRLRGEPAFAALTLVCYTVERDPAIVDGMLAAGCDAVVGKSEGIDHLLDMLRGQVARSDRSGINVA